MRILLFGHIGRGNLGDDLMAQSILRLLKDRGYSDIRILGNQTLDEQFEYWDESVRNYLVNIVWADVVILNGGNYLHDKSNNIRFLFSPFIKIGGVALLSFMFRRKFIMTGQGFGPFRTKLAEATTRLLTKAAYFVSVRDAYSYELLLGRERLSFVQDSVFLLQEGSSESRQKAVLGLNLVPWGKVYCNDVTVDVELARNICSVLNGIEDRFDEIVFYSFNEKESESDACMYDLVRNYYDCDIPLRLVQYNDIVSFRDEFKKASVFVGMRFHGHVLALLEKIPILSIPYHSKCEHIMSEFGIKGQSVARGHARIKWIYRLHWRI